MGLDSDRKPNKKIGYQPCQNRSEGVFNAATNENLMGCQRKVQEFPYRLGVAGNLPFSALRPGEGDKRGERSPQ